MRLRWIVLPLLAFSLVCFAPGRAMAAASPASGAQYDHSHDHDWDAPPAEFREAQRQGFHDGIEGARKDFENHRPPKLRIAKSTVIPTSHTIFARTIGMDSVPDTTAQCPT